MSFDSKDPNAPDFCPQDLSRRRFLKFGMSSFIGAIAMKQAQLMTFAQTTQPAPLAEHCIVMFMNGGPSQLDTFDPKPNSPNGGPFKTVSTSVPGLQFAETLPLLAEQAHHLAVIRSMATREGNHERARYLLHTGYAPTGSVKHPTFGSLVSHYLGNESFELPHCININSPSFNSGFLNASHDPFVVSNPLEPIDDIEYPEQMDAHRFQNRLKMLQDLEKDFLRNRSGRSTEAHQAIYKKADKMINSERKKAFELQEEPMAIRQAYGMNQFGQGCLMARRLIERGVKFVEISLDGWDTHDDNFTRVGNLMQVVDPAFASLINDLSERELLDKTLVIWMGEFGRTPKINKDEGRDHFPNGWSMTLAGGGVRGGQVIGQTDNEGKVLSGQVSVQDVFASLCFALGIDHNHENYSRSGRPIRVVSEGQLIQPLFA
ncbi:hypothetical protein CMK19_20475 [Candidatus Poribacteria bacterium]|jgi:hypothetical protein|nr:hypothetical protein [Candidatus Poribacteria bacterium]|tara:strand:- start:595 stop:1890 length:1296 start_codon:yes stop_codon:yes gene_type:complete